MTIQSGIIRDYEEFKMYGYINGDDGFTYYFHKTDCIKFIPVPELKVKFFTAKFLNENRATLITIVN